MSDLEKRRKTFFVRIADFFKDKNVQVVTEMPKESVILTTAVEDFEPRSNEIWQLEGNKSYPRDAVCDRCLRQVVMSNGAWDMYLRANKQNEIICSRCILGKMASPKGVYKRVD